jgi:hypothetical protein
MQLRHDREPGMRMLHKWPEIWKEGYMSPSLRMDKGSVSRCSESAGNEASPAGTVKSESETVKFEEESRLTKSNDVSLRLLSMG